MVSYLEKANEPPPLDTEQCAVTATSSSEDAVSIEKASGDDDAKPAGEVSKQPLHTAPGGRAWRWRLRLRSASRTVLQFLTPPTCAAILSIFIAAITPLQVSLLARPANLCFMRDDAAGRRSGHAHHWRDRQHGRNCHTSTHSTFLGAFHVSCALDDLGRPWGVFCLGAKAQNG